ncbi:hypothetical protein ACS0TY_000919 [Phlomoides rotata]
MVLGKKGGNMLFTRSMDKYRITTSDLGLYDLGYRGYNFTWTNGREGLGNIQSRLDRAWANALWTALFPKYRVFHRPKIKSDHSPLVVACDRETGVKKKRKRPRVLWF